MRINYLEYHDRKSGWKLERTYFNDLTLLVGASGAGKTKILNAIILIRDVGINNIPEKHLLNGISWKIGFEISNKNYEWILGFNFIEGKNGLRSIKKHIKFEEVKCNNEEIASRNSEGKIFFEMKEIPRLPSDQSLISLLKEEQLINPIFEEFEKIISSQSHEKSKMTLIDVMEPNHYKIKIKELSTIEKIRTSNYDSYTKLVLASQNAQSIFRNIENDFSSIFPNVEKIKVEFKNLAHSRTELPGFRPNLLIKEKKVLGWIHESTLSEGMFKTILLLSELYLSQDGTIILIDEFENSLGVNCINQVTSAIINSDRAIQFILTSHHPYIINNIDSKYWKIVTREGSIVKTHSASEFNLGRSRHSAFTQLLNLEAYQTGIAS